MDDVTPRSFIDWFKRQKVKQEDKVKMPDASQMTQEVIFYVTNW